MLLFFFFFFFSLHRCLKTGSQSLQGKPLRDDDVRKNINFNVLDVQQEP